MIKNLALAGFILIGLLIFLNNAKANTESKSVNVIFSVPAIGGGNTGGGADNLPVILNPSVTVGQTTATVSWTATDDKGIATNNFVYGKDLNYNNAAAVAGASPNYSVSLTNLDSNTVYYYKILVTDTKPQTAEATGQFITAGGNVVDVTPPSISNIQIVPSVYSATISWDTDELATGEVDYGLTANYTLQKLENNLAQTFTVVLTNLDALTTYHFQIVATDALGNARNTNDAEFTTLAAQPPAQCDLNNINCADPLCAGLPKCQPGPGPGPTSEICNNNIDDDNNGLTDCADGACAGFSGCVNITPSPGGQASGGGGTMSTQLDISKIIFLVGNSKIRIGHQGQTLTSLAGTALTIQVLEKDLKLPGNLNLSVGSQIYPLTYSLENNSYSSNIIFPAIGDNLARLNIDYGNGQIEYISFILRGLPLGDIRGENSQRLEGVTVILMDNAGQAVTLEPYGQINPLVTNANGNYGWVVPNGLYRINFNKEEYFGYEQNFFRVENNVINFSVNLIKKPKSLTEVVDPTKSVGENFVAIAVNLTEQTKILAERGWQAVGGLKRNERTQVIIGVGVAPASVGVAVVSLLSFLTFSNLLPFLRLLFLQPLMLLGLRRRQKWGQVYNALNKLPIDLATIRLINADTDEVIQTRVTDKKGRYAFVANPGRYKLEVVKNRLAFPTSLLFNYKEDGRRTDLYHGEIIMVTEKDAVITANIPLDPIGEIKTPVRLIWYQTGRLLQSLLSSAGWLVTLTSLYISPRWYVWALAAVHTILFFVFRHLALPPKIKSWGIVNDAQTKQPIDKTVARLFNAQFNKLVSTQITDKRGRYYFMAGDDKYFVTYDHNEYTPHKTEVIDLQGKDADTIAKDVELKKTNSAGALPPVITTPQSPTPPVVSAPVAPIAPPQPPIENKTTEPPSPPSPSNINKPNENILG